MTSGDLYFAEAEDALHAVRLPAAIDLFEKAERHGYDADLCSAKRWICNMLLGEFESAWKESDCISARGRPDPNRFWDGMPVDGRTVLIRCLHGLGDTLQFVRYARLIRARARSLVIETQPSLKNLLIEAQLADEVITWGEREPFWDQQIEVIELPRVFRTTLDSIPVDIPYLTVRGVERLREYDGSRPFRLGVVWACSGYNPSRSMPLQEVAALFAIPDVRFFSFQGEPERSRSALWGEVVDAYDGTGCLVLTAKRLQTMDLIVTVDTMIAHLAGAMGRPVWTLLPFACDWRWMLDRADSPWYPTMRLFRQRQPGNWTSVIETVAHELRTVLLAYPTAALSPARVGDCVGPGRVK